MKPSKKSGINENSGVVSPGIVPIARLSVFLIHFHITILPSTSEFMQTRTDGKKRKIIVSVNFD